MQELLKLQQRIVPEFIELLEKRYNILRTIYYHQPIGRRILANYLSLGERCVRNEVDFLKEQNFIKVHNAGMHITSEGEEVIDKLKEFIHELRGLSELEETIKKHLNLKKVLVVPGDCENDISVLKEIGRVAAARAKKLLQDNTIIAIAGGSSVKELVENVPTVKKYKEILVVPARGGMGRSVETQANTLAAKLAEKINGSYKLLHVPDNLSDKAVETMLNEDSVREIVDNIHNCNLLIYGIGRADEMAKRRRLPNDIINEILTNGSEGEAFGHYFDENGNISYHTPTIGVKHEDIHKIDTLIAVAGGKSKAKAIIATQKNLSNGILVIDEGAAIEMINIMVKK